MSEQNSDAVKLFTTLFLGIMIGVTATAVVAGNTETQADQLREENEDLRNQLGIQNATIEHLRDERDYLRSELEEWENGTHVVNQGASGLVIANCKDEEVRAIAGEDEAMTAQHYPAHDVVVLQVHKPDTMAAAVEEDIDKEFEGWMCKQ